MGSAASVKRKGSDSDDEKGENDDDEDFASPGKMSPSRLFPSRTKHTNCFSQKELEEIEEIESMQRKITAFVSKHFYYAVPVNIVRSSVDPYSPVFVQPDVGLAVKRVGTHDLDSVQKGWDLMKSVPSSVMVNYRGDILILVDDMTWLIVVEGKVTISFEKSGASYDLSIENILQNISKSCDNVQTPSPPTLLSRTISSLRLGWKNLPDPPGLTQYVEVQYARILQHKNKSYFKYLDTISDPEGIFDFDQERINTESWSAFVSKTWDQSSFTENYFEDLSPGSLYIFRLRYRNHRGWSDYSKPSSIFRTEPGIPSPPVAPLSEAIMPHAVHLRWAPPSDTNGAKIESYILEGKGVGDDFSAIFTGMRLSFVVFNLYPEQGYNFRVTAVNKIGQSSPSSVYSIITPATLRAPPYCQDWRNTDGLSDFINGTNDCEHADEVSQSCYRNAERCEDAWVMHYDLESNQNFYFNILTGSRRLRAPPSNTRSTLLDTEIDDFEQDEVKEENETKRQFRLKRFRFVESVHQNRKKKYEDLLLRCRTKNKTEAPQLGYLHSSPLSAPFTMHVDRKTLLSDAFKEFIPISDANRGNLVSQCDLLGKLTRKLRVIFHQEDGIDAGGLSKEFFLVLSDQLTLYMSKHFRNILTSTESGRLFFNEGFRDDGAKSLINKSAAINSKLDSFCLAELSQIKLTGEAVCKFFGYLLGKSIYDQQMMNIPLAGVLLSHLVNSSANGNREGVRKIISTNQCELHFCDDDLFDLDKSLFKSLEWMTHNSIEGVIDNTFTVTSGANNDKTVNLCKNGDKIELNDCNKLEYVKLMKQWKTTFCVNNLLNSFLSGFWEVVPLEVIKENEIGKSDLDLMLNGKPAIDVEEIRAFCVFQGESNFSDNHIDVISFWHIIREFDDEHKRLFLLFVTGTSRVPLDGYVPPFNITQGVDMPKNSLPRAHTCFNQLVLPSYSSREVMKEKLLFAIAETEGFQLT